MIIDVHSHDFPDALAARAMNGMCRMTEGTLWPAGDGTLTNHLDAMELASLAEYIDEGIPVIVWATIDMERVTDYYEVLYYDRYGSYYYPENEHCLVLVGYNENRYFFADPYESRGIVSYPKSDCEAAFADLGKQSVVVRPQQ